jgi:hypothetical protein
VIESKKLLMERDWRSEGWRTQALQKDPLQGAAVSASQSVAAVALEPAWKSARQAGTN